MHSKPNVVVCSYQAQPVNSETITKLFGNRVACSPIVTVEPRRRKFHKPITLTIPVPKASQKGMINQYQNENPTLRLLCSITGTQCSVISCLVPSGLSLHLYGSLCPYKHQMFPKLFSLVTTQTSAGTCILHLNIPQLHFFGTIYIFLNNLF